MKALLSNCASAAVQHDPQLKSYRCGGRYQRKVNEGKAKMTPGRWAVLNAVKAKLIDRVFATINRGTAYVLIIQYSRAS
jgi:transposase